MPSDRRSMSVLTAALWSALVLLVIVGVAAGVARAVFIDDLATRSDPFRVGVMKALDRHDPFIAERPAELVHFDGQYAARPRTTLLHVLPGALFLLLAPFQFSKRIRGRHPRVHRWSGRLLLVIAAISAVPGLYFGLVSPAAGQAEALLVALVGVFIFTAMFRGFVAIRRREVQRHREWMIRLFSAAIGISTTRLVILVLDPLLTPAGVRLQEIFILSLWIGWVLTVGVAEVWIRYTRPRRFATQAVAGLQPV